MEGKAMFVVTTDNFKPWGFWGPSEENARTLKYLVAHDCKNVLEIYKIKHRFQVTIHKRYEEDGSVGDEKKKDKKTWCFNLEKVPPNLFNRIHEQFEVDKEGEKMLKWNDDDLIFEGLKGTRNIFYKEVV